MPTSSREPMGLFPNLQGLRMKLGWSIQDLLQKTSQAPSEKSVRRLEKGVPVRLATAHKLFNAVNAAKPDGKTLIRDEEVVVVKTAD